MPVYADETRYAVTTLDNQPYHNAGDAVGVYIGTNKVGYETSLVTAVSSITDSGIFNQPYINVSIPSRPAGTTSFVLIIQMDVKEVDDGYQEIYVYNGTSSSASQLANSITFEHTAGSKDTTWYRYTFYVELLNSQIINDCIVIRFGAHGSLGDKWQFTNFRMMTYCGNAYYTSQRNISTIHPVYHSLNSSAYEQRTILSSSTPSSSDITYPALYKPTGLVPCKVYYYEWER